VTDLFPGFQSSLPLGTNSSFLSAVVAGGVAPSEVFGLWAGSRGIAPVDGLLVIGGYDQSRVAAPFTNYSVGKWSLQKACPLQVTIADITYAGQSLFRNSSEKLIACVEPQTQRFVFTPDIATQFGIVSGQNTTEFERGMRYNVTRRPSGNLTIKFDNGYTTTIPNEELFAPLRGSDQYGRYSITNDSVLEAGVGDNRNEDPSTVNPTLGGLFLTFNYLLVDYEKGVFGLAPAVPSTNTSAPVDIRTVCTPSNITVPAPSTSPTSKPKSKTNVGAIAGGTVGAVAGVSLLAFLAFLAVRYRRRYRQKHATEPANEIGGGIPHVRSGLSEMSAVPEVRPVELPTSRHGSMEKRGAREMQGSEAGGSNQT